MRIIRYVLTAVFACLVAMPALAQEKSNLLVRPDLQISQDHSVGVGLDAVFRLKDGDLETAARITSSATAPVELVFSFTGATVTPSEVRVMVAGLSKDSAKIEVLASELGPDSGFVSLRTEPLKATDNWQSFRFEPVAATWLMVKVTPFADSTEFDIQELEITGHDGPPVSLYAFDEAPGDALTVLQSLAEAGVPLDIHPDEASLFEDAADGQFDTWSFAEASLLSSGLYDPELRAQFLAYLTDVTKRVGAVTEGQTAFEKGQVLLTMLHEGPMKQGYLEKQTDMSKVLETGAFNCVSSATLYNIIARGMGLDARGIEVPDHAFSILYDGTDHADIETTTVRGFNPARNKAGLSEFARTTGFTYISDKNRAKRREIDEAGMVALTYYNHGVTATDESDYPKALLNYFKALSLDPRNKSAIKNTLAVLGRWSNEAIGQDDYARAVEILDAGLRFAPGDRSMRHNMRFALTKALKDARDQESVRLVAFSKDLFARTDDKNFLRIQAQALTERAYEAAKLGSFEAALTLTTGLGGDADERSLREMKKLRSSLFLNWSNQLLDSGDYAQAVDILERSLVEGSTDHRVKNNLAYVVKQWGASVASTEGTEASQVLLVEMSKRFPKIRALQSVAARNYDVEAKAAYDSGNYEDAIAIYQAAIQVGVDEGRMKRNELAVWSTWGLGLMEQGDFAGALAVFELGLNTHPKEFGFKQNIAFIVQEWTGAVAAQDGILAAEAAIAAHRGRFETVKQLSQMQGRYINSAVNEAKTAEDFETLAPVLLEASAYAKSKHRYDQMVAFFYQEWARTEAPELDSDGAVAILQSGVDAFPENRDQRKLFINAVNRLGTQAMGDEDWSRAMSIFRGASRSLPDERSFAKAIAEIEKRL